MIKLSVEQIIIKAKAHAKKGEVDEARDLFNSVLRDFPKNKRAQAGLNALSMAKQSANVILPLQTSIKELGDLFNQGKLQAVVGKAQSLAKSYPNEVVVWNILGTAQAGLGRVDEASKSFKKAIELNPAFADSYNNLGLNLIEKGKLQEAIQAFKKAISLEPNHAKSFYNLGNALKKQDKLPEALEFYNKALLLKPNYTNALNNKGNLLKDLGRLDEAIVAYKKALTLKPDNAQAYNNIGLAFKDQGKLGKAKEAYKKALSINPNHDRAHTNLALIYLAQGNLEAGVKHRRWRWKSLEDQKKLSHLKLPEWDGKKSLRGKSLLVVGEQGPGDIIIWSVALDYLKSMDCDITLQCREKLLELFKMSFSGINIKPTETRRIISSDDYDYFIPMETLFGYFCINQQDHDQTLNFSAPAHYKTEPFLFPDKKRVNFWKKRLNGLGKGPFVGISWKSPLITSSRKKNYSEISDWEPLFLSSTGTYINLQSTNFESDIYEILEKYGIKVHNFDDLDQYNDLADVAALCSALDVCVSIATAVATVAAAVGTPTKLLSWRQSPWNNVLFSPSGPNVTIYERNTWETWSSCFKEIAKDIKSCS